MNFHRRTILKAGLTFSAMTAIPGFASAQTFAPQPGKWRQFEVVTRLTIDIPKGQTQAWVPLPSVNEKDWFKSESSSWKTNGRAVRVRDPKYGAEMLRVTWDDKETQPWVEVTSKIATRDRAIDLSKPGKVPALSKSERRLYLASTDLIPTGGVVKETSDKIVAGKKTDIEKARAIYEWVVENTFRDPATRGCGTGDIAAMLKTGNLGGKCADLNALYVGLARAAGLPARDVYGLRVAPSQFGYKSLGANTEVISKAQHCRAEVYLAGFGWVPVDPADVRKVVLEEPPANLAVNDPKVVAARKALFGSWETNWLAYNFGHDLSLPGSRGPKVGFLMYPQGETGGQRLDSLDPDSFKYRIVSKEVSA
jgi:transglutaminase-like putative cysteine protease